MKPSNTASNITERSVGKRRGLGLEKRVLVALLLCVSPVLLMLILIMALGDYSALLWLTLVPIALVSLIAGIWYIQQTLQKQFFGVANVIECLRNGDFTMRASVQDKESAWGEVNLELNRLAVSLHDNRINAVESQIILDKMIEEFNVPILITDRSGALRHLNEVAVTLFGKDRRDLVGLSAAQLKIGNLMESDNGVVVEHQFPSRGGKWEVRRNVIRQHGSQYNLLLLNDLSDALREEQRLAWQKLIRVLGHELNNSLASITSVAETMSNNQNVSDDPMLSKGLGVIVERGHGLQRFTEAYTSLAKLPPPQKIQVNLVKLIEQVKTLLSGDVTIEGDSSINVEADRDQLEQVLINLIKNGLESGASKPNVDVAIRASGNGVYIDISDNGQGITNPDNLFVPFYTTKQSGTGVGLFLSRQIIEAHQGKLSLNNRPDKKGCVASIWLPI